MICKLLIIGRSSLIKWMRYPKEVNPMEREDSQTWNVVARLWEDPGDTGGLVFTTLFSPLPHNTRLGRSQGMSPLRLGYINWLLRLGPSPFVSFPPGFLSYHVVSNLMARPPWQGTEGCQQPHCLGANLLTWVLRSPAGNLTTALPDTPSQSPSYISLIPDSHNISDNKFWNC